MASAFWDSEGIMLVEFLERGATISSERYVRTLKKLKQRIRKFRKNRKMNQVLLTTEGGTPVCAQGKQSQQWWGTVVPHPPYSSDLAPSDFHLLCLPEECTWRTQSCWRRRAETRGAGRATTLQQRNYVTAVQRLTQRWKRCGDGEGDPDFVEKLSPLSRGCGHEICKSIIIVVIVYY
jgi:hypothetical protein